METYSASPVPGEFPAQRSVTRSFDVFFDLRLNKQLSKQWSGWWFGTQSFPLWRHSNDLPQFRFYIHHRKQASFYGIEVYKTHTHQCSDMNRFYVFFDDEKHWIFSISQ